MEEASTLTKNKINILSKFYIELLTSLPSTETRYTSVNPLCEKLIG